MRTHPGRRLAKAMVAAGLLLGGATGAVAQSGGIGVAATAVREVTGDAGGALRPLGVGNPVFQDETVATGERSNTQLLFRDQTTLTIGPASAVALDRFVFNPAGTADEFSVEITRGALRFVSGQSRPNSYRIRTPIATIGVRGTIIDVFVFPGFVIVILTEGAFNACFNARCADVVRPGTYVIIYADGRVQGPKRWDGSLKRLVGPISFPLYGWHLDLDRVPRYVYDERRDDTDQIDRHRFERREPPSPQPEDPPPEDPIEPVPQ